GCDEYSVGSAVSSRRHEYPPYPSVCPRVQPHVHETDIWRRAFLTSVTPASDAIRHAGRVGALPPLVAVHGRASDTVLSSLSAPASAHLDSRTRAGTEPRSLVFGLRAPC